MKNLIEISEKEEYIIDIEVEVNTGGKLPEYDGETEVTPSFEEQVLKTENKSVMSNITVKEIPVVREENIGGGITVIIG